MVVTDFDAGAARPGKVVGSVLRFNNCGAAAAAETLEQRRMVRNPAVPTQYTAATGCSYPRRNASCKNEREDNEVVDGSNGLQPKPPQYIPRKVTAAQGGSGSQWY